MFIKSIEVKDLRSFEYFKLSFSEQINLIIGANNSGKSTIIKSLYKLQNSNTLNKYDIRTSRESSHILVELNNVSETEKTRFINDKVSQLHNKPKVHVLMDLYDSGAVRNQVEKKGLENVEINLENIFKINSQINLKFTDFKVLPNYEHKGNFIFPFFSKRKTSHLSSQGGQDSTYLVSDNFQNLPAKLRKVTSHPNLRKDFEAYCKEILGFTIGIIPGEGNEDKIGMYSGLESSDNPIPVESMGEGVINIIGLIIILLADERKLFLIEELENDIHPKALKKLLNLIVEKSNKNQFIISTHSNIVLRHLGGQESTKVFFTDVKYDETSNMFTSSINELENEPDKRMAALEELGYEFSDYDLHEGWLFFEESSAEELVKNYFIRWYFPNTNLAKFKTFSARTITQIKDKFDAFNSLFVYLHLTNVYKNKAWVIVDAGSEEKEVVDKFKNYYVKHGWSENNFQQWGRHDFEEYYPEQFQDRVAEIIKAPKKDRPKLKAELLHDVKAWIVANPKLAKSEFEKSAKEVIQILENINSNSG